MSVLTRSFRWMMFACAILSGSFASAQYHPFAEPLQFDPDWQWFAPVQLQDFDEMTSKQRANHGWFAAYDRMSQGFSRSRLQGEFGRIDFAPGNRYELGWMGNDDSGWLFSGTSVSGPGAYDKVFQQRLNIVNPNDVGDPLAPIFPRADRNDPFLLERVYILHQSLNAGSYSSFDINKTWRMEPYRYGGILEPMVGFKYTNYVDHARNDSYGTTLALDIDGDGTADVDRETYIQDIVDTSNKMMLGQVGFRYIQYSNRWTLSAEAKAFAGPSLQYQQSSLLATATDYATGVASGDPIVGESRAGTGFTSRRNVATAVGLDLRAEASFAISKAINLRFGGNLNYFGTGIWRGITNTAGGGVNNQSLQNQPLVMPGLTFGFSINR